MRRFLGVGVFLMEKGRCFDLLTLILVLQLSNQAEGQQGRKAEKVKEAKCTMSKNLAMSQED